jgi:hypothetical protein
MDKLLGMIPKGYGTKVTAGGGMLVAALSLIGGLTGHPIPGIQMETGTALTILWGGLVALHVRRAAAPAK